MALTAQRKPSPHHQKARGNHHRQSKHYLRTYAPYLPLLLVVVIGLAINSLWSFSSRQAVLGASTGLQASSLLSATNQQRTNSQESALQLNNQLNQAAEAKANDMATRDYWSHNAPDGTTPWHFIKDTGYQYVIAGENLAYGFTSPDTTLHGWMNSPEHRANILNKDYQDVGFGIVHADNYLGNGPTTIIVALYGQPTESSMSVTMQVNPQQPAPTETPQPQIDATSTSQPSQPATPSSDAADTSYRSVSRIEAITGSAAWSTTIISVVVLIALAVLVYRHSRAWHRLLIRGEQFVLHHKLLDIIVLSVLVGGIILTRSAGFIG